MNKGSVTDKSFKMLQVTRMLEKGAKSDGVALQYKHNSEQFKVRTAGKVLFLGTVNLQ